MKLKRITRREFVAGCSLMALSPLGCVNRTKPAVGTESQLTGRKKSPTLRLGIIGCGYQGTKLLEEALKDPLVQVVSLCDIDRRALAQARALCASSAHPNVRGISNFKDLLIDPGLDAVVVATPDHWHFAMGSAALKSGKDVLLEKPVTHTWQEALELEKIQAKTGRLLQVGTNLRSNPLIHEAVRICQDIGSSKISRMVIRIHKAQKPLRTREPLLDFDPKAWAGTSANWVGIEGNPHGRWHHFWNYGGGHFLNFGVHLFDLVAWILGDEVPAGQLSSMEIYGARLRLEDGGETPNVMWGMLQGLGFPLYFELLTPPELPDGLKHRRTLTVEYLDQAVEVDLDGRYRRYQKGPQPVYFSRWSPDGHLRNFVRASLWEGEPSAPLSKGLGATEWCHLINKNYRESLGGEGTLGRDFKKRLSQGWPADFAKNASRLVRDEDRLHSKA